MKKLRFYKVISFQFYSELALFVTTEGRIKMFVNLFKTTARSVLTFIILFSAFTTYAAQPQVAHDIKNKLVVEAFVDGVVKQAMQNTHTQSGVVVVMKDGELVLSKGYGYADIDKQKPVNPKTSLFRAGSISKLFTWVAVMQLVEQGTLDLDIDVNQYLNTFKVKDSWPGRPITMRHIMTHTTGLEDALFGFLVINDIEKSLPLAQSLKEYQPARVNPPGEHTAYNNWSTALAGLIVANISGLSFYDYIQKNIFDPLGMKKATFAEPIPKELIANLAKAYNYQGGRYVEMDFEIFKNFTPAATLSVSGEDIALFAKALLNDGANDNGRILQGETLKQMLSQGFSHDDRVTGLGLGFFKRPYGAKNFNNFGHDGATTLYHSHLGMSQQESLMIFSSFSGGDSRRIRDDLQSAFYKAFYPKESITLIPPADFFQRSAKYAATYHSWRSNFTQLESIIRPLTAITITPLQDNTLLIGADRYVEIETNLFQQLDGTKKVAFQESSDGVITGFVYDGSGMVQYYPAAFYETYDFLFYFIACAMLIFIGTLLWVIYQWKLIKLSCQIEKRALLSPAIVASSNILFFIMIYIVFNDYGNALVFEVPTFLKFSLIFPLLTCIATAYQIYQTFKVWQLNLGQSIIVRIHHSIVSITALLIVCFYNYWNFIGFSYFG